MANYESVGRTNYFGVRDTAALEALLSETGIEIVREPSGGRIALIDDEGSDWTVPLDEDDDDIFIPDVIAEYLQPGQIAVFQRVGREAMRYVAGDAIAVNDKGEQVVVGLDDIYAKAAEKFGVDASSISPAAY